MSKFRVFSIIFFSALFIECAAIALGAESARLFSKPSLVLILLIYFWSETRERAAERFLIILALFFSWLGDLFLLFESRKPNFFILGLGSFFAAHIFYIIYFLRIRRKNAAAKRLKLPQTAGVVVYVAFLYGLLAPHLGNLQMPVAFYTLVISGMLLSSLHAFDFAARDFGKLCVAGTVLFVVSDSMLAINRFYQPFFPSAILIMLTYGIAQFLIINGAERNLRFLAQAADDD